MKHRAQDYIINGFTDVLFLYADSGDFSIIFDTRVFSSEYVHNQIDLMGKELVDSTGDGSVCCTREFMSQKLGQIPKIQLYPETYVDESEAR